MIRPIKRRNAARRRDVHLFAQQARDQGRERQVLRNAIQRGPRGVTAARIASAKAPAVYDAFERGAYQLVNAER
jgi:hypothetical protein